MPKLKVDDIEVEVPAGATVLQACELAGKEIPRFCYHERLSIAGNCRMCLVEMEKSPKPVASCAMPAGDGMVVKTMTPMVKRAREGVMEFLLANHPLDCPICDQGGECDLQDQALAFGRDRSRFAENKRAVEEKYMGPLIKTVMTRCIHCTRCIRFSTEVAGVEEIGAIGRGEDMEVTTYLEQAVSSELSGNIIDLCPVGALTSKPNAFMARSWELNKTPSIDVMDALGSNIRVDARGLEVMRILPRLNEDVNEEWISDKARYVWDGLKSQRLDKPYVRDNGKLRPASWAEAFDRIAAKLNEVGSDRAAAIIGDLACAESMKALGDLWAKIGSPHIDCRQDGAKIGGEGRPGYLFNSTIAGIDQTDAVLLVGTNPRWEAPVLNARLRGRTRSAHVPVAGIGTPVDLTYDVDWLGAGVETLRAVADGTHPFAATLRDAKHPMMIVGQAALAREDGTAVLALASRLAETCGLVRPNWNGFNILHIAAARVGGLDLGLLPGPGGLDVAGICAGAQAGRIGLVYLLGADEVEWGRHGQGALGDAFVIYQGSHGDRGAHRADVILPGAAYTEKDATWVNTEGRVQRGRRAIFPPGDAREDWTILRALSAVLGKTLPYDTLDEVRRALAAAAPTFETIDHVAPAQTWRPVGVEGPVSAAPFGQVIADYYFTNPIARASAIMAECSALFMARGTRAAAE